MPSNTSIAKNNIAHNGGTGIWRKASQKVMNAKPGPLPTCKKRLYNYEDIFCRDTVEGLGAKRIRFFKKMRQSRNTEQDGNKNWECETYKKYGLLLFLISKVSPLLLL